VRLLIVEDEPDLASAIARGLRRDGHAVDVALTSIDADIKLRSAGYDLVCLDWNLPDGSGLAICRDLISGDIPTLEDDRPRILMLTARDDIEDRVAGLDAGADDYLVKPFAFSELLARINALARRPPMTNEETILTIGGLEMDLVRRTVSRAGQAIDLQPREFRLLEILMRNAGQIVTRTMLLEQVWNFHFDPKTNVVDAHISRLRAKVDKPFDAKLIQTARGAGYRIDEPE